MPGLLLLFSAIVALIWANSPWKGAYHHLWETPIRLQIGDWSLSRSLHHFINDGFMAVFFFVVGLELKRAWISGPLSKPSKALLPIAAAIGGMLFPALIFLGFNAGTPQADGWGIPMATDIAFALGVLSLAAPNIPPSYRLFLTALAIADDLGAVLVIAFFYTSQVHWDSLLMGMAALSILFAANKIGVRSPLFYATVGIGGVWLAFLVSGIHPTIAGVLAAFMIPARPKVSGKNHLRLADKLLYKLRNRPQGNPDVVDPSGAALFHNIQAASRHVLPPLQRLEHFLHPWVSILILPLFALANAGVVLPDFSWQVITEPLVLGVFLGLLVGKVLGICAVGWLAAYITGQKLPVPPKHPAWWALGFLGGIGFTMALFISVLAFKDPQLKASAKTAVLLGSLISGVLAVLLLKIKPLPQAPSAKPKT